MKKEKIVRIGGREWAMKWNMRMAVEFEIKSGEVFTLSESFRSIGNQLLLIWICLKLSNKGWDKSVEEFEEELEMDELREVESALSELLGEFYQAGQTDPKNQRFSGAPEEGQNGQNGQEGQKDGGDKKNG